LLGEDEKVTARTGNAVRAAVAAGAQFVLATGRPPRWIPPVVDGLGFAPMAVCANGAVIYDPATDRVLSARTLPVATLAELAELAKHIGLEGDITYSTNNGLVEIVAVGIDKATGIAEIAGPLGITDADIVAFGDMPNDVPMLLRAGLGVAMGNAHPDAIAAADE